MVKKPNTESLTQQEKNILEAESTSANIETNSKNSVQISPESRKTAFIPENLDLANFLSDNPPDFDFEVDSFKYIINLITAIPAMNKSILKKYDYVPINAGALRSEIRNYKAYFTYLVDNGIFETDNHYIPDAKSKGFRFTSNYSVPMKIEQIASKKLVENNHSYTPFELRMQKRYHYLHKWLDEGLSIDFPNAQRFLRYQYDLDCRIDPKKAIMRYNANYYSLYKIKEKDFYFKVDKNIGRLHTNLTNISSSLRNFITYNDEKLVNVDLKNCQPLLSTVLLDERFYEKNTVAKQSSKPTFNIYNVTNPNFIYHFSKSRKKSHFSSLLTSHISTSSLNLTSSYIMMSKQGETHDRKGIEVYKRLAQKGWIYEYLGSRIIKKTGQENITRKEVKKIFFTVLFTSNRFLNGKKAMPKRLFKSIFPDVYKVFSLIKAGNKNNLSWILQRMESKLILDRICKRIYRESPEIPIFTIHDSIVCPKEYKKYVAYIMKDEIKIIFGILAKTGFDNWSPEELTTE